MQHPLLTPDGSLFCKTTNLKGLRESWKRNRRALHYATLDFLSSLVALANFLRLSLRKAAYAAVVGCRDVGNPGALRSGRQFCCEKMAQKLPQGLKPVPFIVGSYLSTTGRRALMARRIAIGVTTPRGRKIGNHEYSSETSSGKDS